MSLQIRDETESDAPDVFAIHAFEARSRRVAAGGLRGACARSLSALTGPDRAAPIV